MFEIGFYYLLSRRFLSRLNFSQSQKNSEFVFKENEKNENTVTRMHAQVGSVGLSAIKRRINEQSTNTSRHDRALLISDV